ncbi:PIN domain-containing protein [Altericista sp. CCNU0014]|uniref:PIN domain-containing protein n=1 Tax=Altericista sp. CCNU0014 TaxID=3082949 RepID=UPI00384DE5DD
MLTGHSSHKVCLPQLLEAQSQQIQGLISTHTLAELYSALTRIPQTQISPALAQNLIRDNLQTFECIPLTAEDYTEAINAMVRHQIPGGGIFDALIAQATLKSQADVLLTLNPKHFTRLGSVIASKVQVPQ